MEQSKPSSIAVTNTSRSPMSACSSSGSSICFTSPSAANSTGMTRFSNSVALLNADDGEMTTVAWNGPGTWFVTRILNGTAASCPAKARNGSPGKSTVTGGAISNRTGARRVSACPPHMTRATASSCGARNVSSNKCSACGTVAGCPSGTANESVAAAFPSANAAVAGW